MNKKRLNRLKQTAEIFTPKELVEEILNKLPENVWEENKTFCDPAAGNGNFLIEIYKYKVEKYNLDPIKSLETIYGVDLMPDNVAEIKFRLYNQIKIYLDDKFDNYKEEIQDILNTNILCKNSLSFNFEFK